jgi:crotonobetainyl-CoA:carnitine CoA-transferase CaiB-like acyl-CoA transferase
MYALNGIHMALYHREKTGQGTAFEVSLFDSMTEWMKNKRKTKSTDDSL